MPTYLQNSTYKQRTIEDVNKVQEFRYKRVIRIFLQKDRPVKKVFYDKELNMHLESHHSYYSHQIEVKEALVLADKEYRKAQDFLRRMNYKYDWIRVEGCSNGKITQIFNIEELRKNWDLLRNKIVLDYKGNAVNIYLENMSKSFDDEQHFKDIFSQYDEYGLLYAPIPHTHKENWETKRIIKLDYNSESALQETITFINKKGNTRKYSLHWEQKTEISPNINIIEAKGIIEYCTLNHQVKKATVDITYTFDDFIINNWKFRLINIEYYKKSLL